MEFEFQHSISALLVLDSTPFPPDLNKHSLVYGFPWPLSTSLLCSNRLNPSHRSCHHLCPQNTTDVFFEINILVGRKGIWVLSQNSHWKSLEQSCFADCLVTECKILFHSFPAPKRTLLLKCLDINVFWCNCGKREDFFHVCTSDQGIFIKDRKRKTVIITQQLCDFEWTLQLFCPVFYLWRLKWHLISSLLTDKTVLYGTQISSFLKINSNVQSLLDLKIL